MVDADTQLTFQLNVGDGMLLASDTVNVLVKDITGTGGTGGGGGMTMTGGTGGVGGATGGTGGATGGGGSGGTTTSTTSSSGGSGGDTGGGGTGGATTTETNTDEIQAAGGSCLCEAPGDGQSSKGSAPAIFSALGLAALFASRRRREKR